MQTENPLRILTQCCGLKRGVILIQHGHYYINVERDEILSLLDDWDTDAVYQVAFILLG